MMAMLTPGTLNCLRRRSTAAWSDTLPAAVKRASRLATNWSGARLEADRAKQDLVARHLAGQDGIRAGAAGDGHR